MKSKKIAIVHDRLYTIGGAEVVLKYLLQAFPNADIFTIVDLLKDKDRTFLENHKVFTSSLQRYKFLSKRHQYFLPLMPYLIEQFDLSEYDIIISSSYFVAKGVLSHPEQLHISYIYSPVRYAWDMYHNYDRAGAFGLGLQRIFIKYWLHRLRIWDTVSSKRPDFLIADSKFVAKRIEKVWRRDSVVIYPPIEVEDAVYNDNKEDYYVTMSRLIEYKKIDVIIEAFNDMPNKKLIIIGDGREKRKLQKIAKSNIIFKGYLPKKEAMKIISLAKGFIFMAKEDFGIAPLEAQACGTPVIAYGSGGAKETVIEKKTGLFVKEQDKDSLKNGIYLFEKMKFLSIECKNNADNFSPNIFKNKIFNYIKEKYEESD